MMKARLVTGLAVVGVLLPAVGFWSGGTALSAPVLNLPNLIPWSGSFDGHYVANEGSRRVLRFKAGIVNVGEGAMEIRGRRGNRRQPMKGFQEIFVRGGGSREFSIGEIPFDSSSQHWYPLALATYELLDADGEPVSTKAKFSACITDGALVRRDLAGARNRKAYTSCPGNSGALQLKVGLSVGWRDVYEDTNRNQILDITNVPPGSYTFRMTADPDQAIRESSYNDNVLTKPVTL